MEDSIIILNISTFNEPWNNRSNSLLVYIPTRTAIVLEKLSRISFSCFIDYFCIVFLKQLNTV